MTRDEAVRVLESREHVLSQQEADEVAASAAFDQASAHLAEVHTRVVVARQQLREAQTQMMQTFSLPGAFMADLLNGLRVEAEAKS